MDALRPVDARTEDYITIAKALALMDERQGRQFRWGLKARVVMTMTLVKALHAARVEKATWAARVDETER